LGERDSRVGGGSFCIAQPPVNDGGEILGVVEGLLDGSRGKSSSGVDAGVF
jgi:hypothetical protein